MHDLNTGHSRSFADPGEAWDAWVKGAGAFGGLAPGRLAPLPMEGGPDAVREVVSAANTLTEEEDRDGGGPWHSVGVEVHDATDDPAVSEHTADVILRYGGGRTEAWMLLRYIRGRPAHAWVGVGVRWYPDLASPRTLREIAVSIETRLRAMDPDQGVENWERW